MGSPSAPPILNAPRGLSLENLESRLNLSTLTGIVPSVPVDAGNAVAQEVFTAKRYRIEAWSDSQAGGGQYGKNWVNEKYAEAQQFFNKFKNRYTTPVTPISPTTPTTTENTAPTTPTIPTETPTQPAPSLPPVSIAHTAKGNLTRLTITGTSSNDSIVVSQSGGTLIINANGQTYSHSGWFGELAIYGNDGDDAITVQSSVSVNSLLYGGSGNNVLVASAAAKSFVVTLGGGNDTVTGNGLNTSFWVDSSDIVNASATEIANGGVHKVSSFYQPFTTNTASADYVPLSLRGQNLRDPTDSGTTVRLTNSLWGTGPVMTDINQGSVGDCYYLAALQSLAHNQPARLQELAVDLGDGTFAVQFKRSGVTSVVRVDADLPAGYWDGLKYAHPSTSGGSIWAPIMEKAYAYFRTGANTFASVNWGWTGSAFSDLGVVTTTFSASTTASTLFSQLTNALTNNKAIAVISRSAITSGAPIVASHAYTIVSTSVENGIQYITLRNPWGYDGAGSDGNAGDGLIKLTLAAFQASFSSGSIMT